MDNIQKKIIKVSEVTAINSKKTKDIIGCKISDGESKYTLWFKKQDGEMTKAYSQWSANKHSIGSEIGIAYKEEPNEYEFTDEKTNITKTIKGVNRTIMWLAEASDMEDYTDKKEPEINIDQIPF